MKGFIRRRSAPFPDLQRADGIKLKKRKSFASRHSRLLTIAGAIIVFVTFLVKERIRDGIREKSNAIESAHTLATIRNDILSVADGVTDVESSVSSANVRGPRDKQAPDSDSDFIINQIGVLLSNTSTAEDLIENVERLSQYIPLGRGYFESLQEQKAELSRLDGEAAHLDDLIQNGQMPPMQEVVDAVKATIALRVKILAVEFALLQEADYVRRFEETRYHVFDGISYGLYFVGWALALTGRLFGLEGVTSGDG